MSENAPSDLHAYRQRCKAGAEAEAEAAGRPIRRSSPITHRDGDRIAYPMTTAAKNPEVTQPMGLIVACGFSRTPKACRKRPLGRSTLPASAPVDGNEDLGRSGEHVAGHEIEDLIPGNRPQCQATWADHAPNTFSKRAATCEICRWGARRTGCGRADFLSPDVVRCWRHSSTSE